MTIAAAHRPAPRFTAQQLLAMPRGQMCHELVEGELIEMSPPGHQHGFIASEVGFALALHVKANALGLVFAAETDFLLKRDPDTVRAPDSAFVIQARLSDLPRDGYFPGAPDLAVEVLSPSDSASAVNAKVLEWLDAGTRMVIVIDPKRRIAQQWTAPSAVQLVREQESLEGGEVLPGWTCPLASVLGDPPA